MDEISQAIGQLQGRMDATDARAQRMEAKMDEQGGKLDQLLAHQAAQRGSRKATAVVVTGAGSVIGALAGWFVTWITSGSGPKHP